MRYGIRDALREVERVRERALAEVERYLNEGDYEGAVSVLIGLEEELSKLVEEARRLKLKGELDPPIYRALLRGYLEALGKAWSLAKERDPEGRVACIYLARKAEVVT